jgi:hypothetical protein
MLRLGVTGLLVGALGWAVPAGAQQVQPGARLPEGAHVVVPAVPDDFQVRGEPQFYQEYLVTSPGIRPSYVPGYIPKVSPRFLNPRVRPPRGSAQHVFSNLRETNEMTGAHFGSPSGWQKTGVTADSPVGDYHQGNLGITRVLQFGYPEGTRVIEPVLVPMPSRSEKAGWYIDAGRPTEIDLGATNNFPEKRGQRQPVRTVDCGPLPTKSSQLSNPNSECAPSGQADSHWANGVQWERERNTGVQRLVRR